jgi:hypothetical protein
MGVTAITTVGPFMRQPSSGRPIALIAGAIVALFVLEHALPAKVEAACGHGSTSKIERKAQALFDRLEVTSVASSEHDLVPENPARGPCSGLGCSDGGLSRPSLPLPADSEIEELWPYLLVGLNFTMPGDSWPLAREASAIPVNRAIALERPPRSSPL